MGWKRVVWYYEIESDRKKEGWRRGGRGKKVEGSVREREEEVSWKDRGEKESGCT